MNRCIYRKAIGALFVALAILGTITWGARARPAQPAVQAVRSTAGGPPVLLLAGQGQQPFRVAPPPELAQPHAQSATFIVNYITPGAKNVLGDTCLAWPTGAQAAFNYAISMWASVLNSPVPIRINACWTSLGPGILGHSAPETYHQGAFGLPNTWYSVALANARSASDLNDLDGTDWDQDGNDADAEMEIAYSSNGISWYFGTDGNTPMEQYDFVSVVLHEVCHGLGFLGSMRVDNGLGYWGIPPANTAPFIYDRFTENGAGVPLLNFSNGSAELAAQLRGGDLYFNGSNARAANDGNRPRLFSPSTWMPGSSYIHLDEVYNGTANALMTYSLNNGEAVHNLGQITRGILTDLGWEMEAQAADVRIVKRAVGPALLHSGDRVTFTLAVANVGDIMATRVVVTDVVPSQIVSLTFASALAITPTGPFSYVWNVEPLAAGKSGMITISGRINPVLTASIALSNTAVIWSAEDNTPGNNRSSAIVFVNGHQVYLPLLMQNWPLVPAVPVLDAIGNSDGDGNYTVSWSAAYHAITYTLEEDDDAGFPSPTVAYSGTAISTTITGRSLGTWYYRVKATNAQGNSGWSGVQSVSVTVFTEDFEGVWPGVWNVFDNNGALYGEYVWGKRICRPYAGAYSGWGVGGGAHGATLTCGSYYPNNAQSWMVYGPFSLAGAMDADLRFKLWLSSQPDENNGLVPHDRACWMASVNGNNFEGFCISGNTGGWSDQALNLTQVPTLGNLVGQPQVWIALIFVSDDSVTYVGGAYVDNITLRRCDASACPGPAGMAATPAGSPFVVFPAAMTLGEP